MKKVLWVCNIMLPAIAGELHMPYSNREGWLSGAFERLLEKQDDIEVGVCFPVSGPELERLTASGRMEGMGAGIAKMPADGAKGILNGIRCYGFGEDLGKPETYAPELEKVFEQVFEDFEPEVLHIFGTEFPHALAAVRAFGKPEKTLIGIQGLCGEIAGVYMAGLPERVQRKVTLRDWIRRDSLRRQQEKFARRGEMETEAIRGCANITGRTAFDRQETAKRNPSARYFAMNETMRRDFYAGEWKADQCQRHSIFLGQGDYPLKGMHVALEALARLRADYPDAVLYVAGSNVTAHGTWKEKLKLPAYGKYLLKLMKQYGLEDHVIMLGKLSSEEMKRQYLNSSVFVCASVLENSPNTLGEAMLLGVPVAASCVGGIPDMLEDGKEGLLYPFGDTKALAAAVKRIWEEPELALQLSRAAAGRARVTHDGETNFRRLLEIYRMIGEQQ